MRLLALLEAGEWSGMSISQIFYLAIAIVILFLAVHPKLILVKETQQPHPFQALARVCLVAMSLFIL
jgi:hypothetical protein